MFSPGKERKGRGASKRLEQCRDTLTNLPGYTIFPQC